MARWTGAFCVASNWLVTHGMACLSSHLLLAVVALDESFPSRHMGSTVLLVRYAFSSLITTVRYNLDAGI